MRSRLLLAGIVAVGLGLRLWGIGFAGGTTVGRPDEEIFSVEALAMFVRPYGRLSTGWPDLAFKLWHAVLWVERAWYHLRYGEGAEVNLGCLLAVNPIALFLPVRVVFAILGAATAWIVGRLAAEIVPERAESAGLWATALYALNYLVGRDGHFAVSDALLCFEIAVTLLCCARVATRGSWWLVAAGFCAGTAVSTKYSALGLAFPCAGQPSSCFSASDDGPPFRSPAPSWPPWPACSSGHPRSSPIGPSFVRGSPGSSGATPRIRRRPDRSSTRR